MASQMAYRTFHLKRKPTDRADFWALARWGCSTLNLFFAMLQTTRYSKLFLQFLARNK